jgi:hypothetical protein
MDEQAKLVASMKAVRVEDKPDSRASSGVDQRASRAARGRAAAAAASSSRGLLGRRGDTKTKNKKATAAAAQAAASAGPEVADADADADADAGPQIKTKSQLFALVAKTSRAFDVSEDPTYQEAERNNPHRASREAAIAAFEAKKAATATATATADEEGELAEAERFERAQFVGDFGGNTAMAEEAIATLVGHGWVIDKGEYLYASPKCWEWVEAVRRDFDYLAALGGGGDVDDDDDDFDGAKQAARMRRRKMRGEKAKDDE